MLVAHLQQSQCNLEKNLNSLHRAKRKYTYMTLYGFIHVQVYNVSVLHNMGFNYMWFYNSRIQRVSFVALIKLEEPRDEAIS